MRTLILFSHGSLLCGSGAALDAHAERLRARGGFDRVLLGYLNYSEPLFADAVAEAVAAGAAEITVAPYFLAPGYFVAKSLPECLDAARAAHPGVAFRVAETLADPARFAAIVVAAADAAQPPVRWDDALDGAMARCRRRADCPLFERCVAQEAVR